MVDEEIVNSSSMEKESLNWESMMYNVSIVTNLQNSGYLDVRERREDHYIPGIQLTREQLEHE